VLKDGWKLQVDARQGKRWLFGLAVDPTERVNPVEQKPEIAGPLEARLDAHDREQGARHFSVIVEGAIDRTIAGSYVPGELYAYWPN